MEIHFCEITEENWEQAIALKVSAEQEGFVASNLYSIAQSKVVPVMVPLGICRGEEMVGFAMIGPETATGRIWIIRFMIGSAYQGRGCGRAALTALIPLVRERYGCREIYLSVEPENRVAIRLYKSLGFVPTGEKEFGDHGEDVYLLGGLADA